MNDLSPEMDALKTRLKATWMAGDYAHFATYLAPGAQAYLERLAIAPGTRMLDVGCGAGQIALPAARAGADVTAVDIASNLIAQARERARIEGVSVRFEEGDAELLPFPDAVFDLVVSLIGAMFAPRPDRVAAELLRVCRAGGTIAMANWTPEGHVGQMFKIIGKHLPPPPLMVSPMRWGDPDTVQARLGPGCSEVAIAKCLYPMHYPFGPAEVVDFFFDYYGPTVRAKAALDPAPFAALREELVQLWSVNNQGPAGRTEIAAEYLDVRARRR